jgi:glutamate dehydrogenase
MRSLVSDFAKAYFRGAADDDLAAIEPSNLAAMALNHLATGLVRHGRKPHVRVFNPDPSADGVRTPHTVAMIICDDMPFLVDSVCMAANQSGLAVRMIIHPVLEVARDKGRLISIEANGGKLGRAESWQWLEMDRVEDPSTLAELEKRIRASLGDVQSAVSDWTAMSGRAIDLAHSIRSIPTPISNDDREEIAALFEWIRQITTLRF